VRWAIEKLIGHGFEPVIPPVLVREEALYGTGFLPDTEQQIYHLPDDDLYLVARARSRSPRCTPARSSIAAAALRRLLVVLPARGGRRGKDTRGIFRVHQFDKVEMFSFVEPDLVARRARAAAGDRGGDPAGARVPYRVVNIGVAELGASAAKKYDCEAWMPGPGSLPRGHVDVEHDRLPGAAA
jgi:seryl-tRNA synthetase